MRCAAVLTVLALFPLSDVNAQQLPLQPGQRVRVTTPNEMLIVTWDSTMQVALTHVTRLEAYQGRWGHFWLGAIIGAGAGAVAGAVAGAKVCGAASVAPQCNQKWASGVGGALLGIVAGGLLGGGIGGLIKTDRWQEIPLNHFRVSVVPSVSGIGARIAF